MIMMEEKQSAGIHRVLLENRKKAVITGVQEIHSFNENEVLLLSEAGKILLKVRTASRTKPEPGKG